MIKKTNINDKLSNGKNVIYTFVKYDNFSDIKELLDNNFVRIADGIGSDFDLETIKIFYKKFLIYKLNDNNKIIGSISELLIHLFMSEEGYYQDCLFLNLEERSMKKGFDGVYSQDGKYFYMESKATNNNKEKQSNRVIKAISELIKKFNPSSDPENHQNNVWLNAYHHARIAESNQGLRKQLSSLAKSYDNNIDIDSAEFNLIPASTIYFTATESNDEVVNNLNSRLSRFKCNELRVLCVSNTILVDILNYFEVKLHE